MVRSKRWLPPIRVAAQAVLEARKRPLPQSQWQNKGGVWLTESAKFVVRCSIRRWDAKDHGIGVVLANSTNCSN
jgi:hypothetical protein